MKKFVFLLFLAALLSFFGYRTIRQSVRNDLAQPVLLPSPSPQPKRPEITKITNSANTKESIFIPYWSLNDKEIEDKYNSYLYFGVTPSGSRINRNEEGYKNIDKFLSMTSKTADKKLVLRMLDSNTTFPILKDSIKQKVLIRDTIDIARDYGFSGIILDLEVSAVPFESLVKQITQFTKLFYEESQNKDLKFSIMFYGDTFYRIRPFDVKALSGNADEFMIMSYDFSKSRGNPGPNFPLRGKEVYGYDMTRMIDDFLRYLPPDKTTVVFGLFGYDWTVDEKGTATSVGSAKTFNEIKKEFISECIHKSCDAKRKNDSRETEIKYTDSEGKNHIVWYEDTESVEAKQNYLKERGIGNFSFWAYSYF